MLPEQRQTKNVYAPGITLYNGVFNVKEEKYTYSFPENATITKHSLPEAPKEEGTINVKTQRCSYNNCLTYLCRIDFSTFTLRTRPLII